jgi:hypothetical protein
VGLAALPPLALALPTHIASTDQALWLASGFYVALSVAGPNLRPALSACEILAAGILCSLALVGAGTQGVWP